MSNLKAGRASLVGVCNPDPEIPHKVYFPVLLTGPCVNSLVPPINTQISRLLLTASGPSGHRLLMMLRQLPNCNWLGLRVGIHEQRGANRGMCGGKAASSAEVRSVRGALFFWLLFFWASKRKVTSGGVLPLP